MPRAVLCLLVVAACARPLRGAPEPAAWLLVHAPEETESTAPRGVSLRPRAPLAEWHAVGGFAHEPECAQVRAQRLDAAVKHARATYGDEARYDLDLRRAVHARCVPAARLTAPAD